MTFTHWYELLPHLIFGFLEFCFLQRLGTCFFIPCVSSNLEVRCQHLIIFRLNTFLFYYVTLIFLQKGVTHTETFSFVSDFSV